MGVLYSQALKEVWKSEALHEPTSYDLFQFCTWDFSIFKSRMMIRFTSNKWINLYYCPLYKHSISFNNTDIHVSVDYIIKTSQ